MFKKNSLMSIGTILVLLGLLGACAPQTPQPTAQTTSVRESAKPAPSGPQRGGTLRLGVDGEPAGLDPHTESGAQALRYSRLFFNALTKIDETGNVLPELAESWSSPDSKTYVFKLRKDVKFHDGTDFNAQAVKFNIDHVMGPKAAGSRRNHLRGAGLTSVEVVDDYTVKFNLKGPTAALPAYLTNGGALSMFSPAAVEKLADQFKVKPVGTGPFELVEWVKADHMTVKRFDGYWRKDEKGNPLPYLDQIIIRPIPDETVRLTALRTGDLDLVDYVAPLDMATVKADQSLKLVEWGSTRFSLILHCVQGPFQNKALRQAVAWAVDREAIHKAIYGGSGAPAQASLDPRNWAFDPQGEFYTRDLSRAKEKLAEGGKASGFKFTAYNYNTPINLRVSQAIQAQLAEVGVNMEIIPLQRAQQSARLSSKEFEAAFTMGYGMPEDPDIDLNKLLGSKGAYNMGQCESAELDSLLGKARQTSDQAERKALYAKIQAVSLDQSSQIFIHHDAINTAMSQKVQGFRPSIDMNHLSYDWMWLQK